MTKVALRRIGLLLLIVSVEALCQSETSVRQWEGQNSSGAHTEKYSRKSLPDAPGPDPEHLSLILDTTAVNTVSQPNWVAFDALTPTEHSTFFDRYLYPSLLKRNLRNPPATGGSFIHRATDAASRLLITRDDSGKGRLNDSYLSGVMTSAVVQTAYTPYWSRTASTPFSNLGSTIGSDAGLNVFHELEPDIRRVIVGHTPRFVSRIEDHIAQSR